MKEAVEVLVLMVALSSSASSSSTQEANAVPTAKTGFARKLKSRETRGFPRTRPATQGQPMRWPEVVVVVVVVEVGGEE